MKQSPEETVLRGMVQVNPNALTGASVSIPSLRNAVELPRDQFDKALDKLSSSGVAALHRHNFPQYLSEEARNSLLKQSVPSDARSGGREDYYVGVTVRHDAASVEEVLDRYNQAIADSPGHSRGRRR